MKLLESVKSSWQTLVVLLTPLVLCPLVFPFSDRSQESKCAALIILMAVYWITESLPLPVTSLLPIALCPLLGIASSRQMCVVFFGDVTFLLVGGIIVAIAIEECKLHKRLALKILMTIGVEPRRLMLGIMLTTAFLSMWISNTATTAMMMPITRAVLAKLFSANIKNKALASHSENTIGDQGAATGEGRTSSEDSSISFSVDVAFIKGKVDNSSKYPPNTEFIELRSLDDLTLAFGGVSSETGSRPDGQLHRSYADLKEKCHLVTDQEINCTDNGVQELQENGVDHKKATQKMDIPDDDSEDDRDKVLKDLDPQSKATLNAFSLCVCYAANIGGMATLTGTAPNMVLSRMAADMSKTNLITFANWFAFSLPVTVITLVCCYLWMNISVFGFVSTVTCKSTATKEEVKRAAETIRQEYNKLGKIRFNEVIVMIHFLLMVALWLSRDPGSVPGWAVLFTDRYVSDASVALAISLSLFIFPSLRPNVLFFRRKGDKSPSKSMPSILTWKQISRKFPWGVLLLLGGGFALSEASQISGLSVEIAKKLLFIRKLPAWASSLVVTSLTSIVTEVTSNTVIVMLMLPILKDIAVTVSVHPMYLMTPATLAASLAFMLPVATPPNAIVFAYGDLKTIDMLKAGAVLNIMGILTVALAINTWGYAIYSLGEVPLWALPAVVTRDATNSTMTSPTLNNFTFVI